MNDWIAARRERAARAWQDFDTLVLVGAGEPIFVPGGADQTYPFIAHAEYFWLTDRETVGGVVAWDPKDGWVDFVPQVTEAERVWEGREENSGTPIQELPAWLAARRGRSVAMLGVPLPGVRSDSLRLAELREALTHVRRVKDATELDRMRRAARATAAGFAAAEKFIEAGVTERAIQIEMETAFFRNGGDRVAYSTIVAAGSNSAVLHFAPTERVVRAGDPVLIDAGAEVGRYASDITRTYRAPGGDSGFFHDLYRVVLGAEERAIARCVPGAEWRDVHLTAAVEMTAGLVALGFLKGDPEELVARDVHALFFPHGLGHLVGLGVRDASGYLPGRTPSNRPGLKNLRTDLPLEAGYTITVEPGLYFVPALLRNPDRRAQFRDAVNWGRVDERMNFGGIRIEDNVHVTKDGPEVLTAAVPTAYVEA